MVSPRLQFSFLFTQSDGRIFGSAYDPQSNERLSYCISPDGTVYSRNDSFPFRGWKYLPVAESDVVRNIAVHSQNLVPNYRA